MTTRQVIQDNARSGNSRLERYKVYEKWAFRVPTAKINSTPEETRDVLRTRFFQRKTSKKLSYKLSKANVYVTVEVPSFSLDF